MANLLLEIKEIVKYRELLLNLVARDIKVRYKKSFLGFVWVMLNPLLMMLILNMVFSGLFKIATKDYAAYLLSGLILWNFFSQSTSASVHSFLGNGYLIKKIYLPRVIFPLSLVLSALLNFVFSLVPLFIIFAVNGTALSADLYILPIGIALIFIFSLGVSLIISTLTVFFHDTIFIYEAMLLAWMYMTPIFYPESIVPEKFNFIFLINPMYYFMGIFRDALYLESPETAIKLIYGLIFSIATFLAGWALYSRNRDRMVFYL